MTNRISINIEKEIGVRFKAIIDELDLMILLNTGSKPRRVLELCRAFNVRHGTIKAHLEKLEDWSLINIEKGARNSKLITWTDITKEIITKYGAALHNKFNIPRLDPKDFKHDSPK